MKIHMVGNAHIDPVWLWRWQDGYAEVKATFRAALDRIAEFPDFIFTCAGAVYYRWIEESEPRMFQEIRRRVTEGRWVIVGGWWIQPDCNIPSGEAFARHSLYGQRYFLEKFGRMSTVGYNVDSFGHSGMLPQIYAQSGMPFYVMMRPQEHEMSIPSSLFWWESPDGSRVLAFRIPLSYATSWADDEPVRRRIGDVAAMAREQGKDLMCFYGVGNHGGGPTRRSIQTIHDMQKEGGGRDILFSSPETYFKDMLSSGKEIPVVRGDLQHHASGCYSAHSETKASNRRAELRVLAAEKFASLAQVLTGLPYPAARLREAWEKVLFNHFHDVMGGCSVPEAYDDIREFYGQSLTVSAEVLNLSAQKISWSVDTSVPGGSPLSRDKDWVLWEKDDLGAPVVVFNPLSWEVTAPVRINRKLKAVTDNEGTPLALQYVRSSRTVQNEEWDTLFIGRVPAMGYRLFWLFRDRELPTAVDFPASVPMDGALENHLLRVEIDPCTGCIGRILDKRSGTEALSAPASALVMDEAACDTWAHGILSFREEIGRFSGAQLRTLESGPLRARLRVTSRYGDSLLRQDFMLHAGSVVIEVQARLDWRETHKMLKLAFPAKIIDPVAAWEIPYGFIERPADGEEEPGQQWIDATGKAPQGGAYGLALLNTGKYSSDIKGGELRMTVARGALFADHGGPRDGLCEYLDQGVQEFRYGVLPHSGDWREAGVVRAAGELNAPVFRVIETYHEGPLPRYFEGARISARSVVATAFKRAEDGDGYVLRCHDSEGRGVECTFELPMLGRSWKAAIRPGEIKTFLVPDDHAAAVKETGVVERDQISFVRP